MAALLPDSFPSPVVSDIGVNDLAMVQVAGNNFLSPLALLTSMLGKFATVFVAEKSFQGGDFVGTDGYMTFKARRVGLPDGAPEQVIDVYFQWAFIESTTGSIAEEWDFPTPFPNAAWFTMAVKGYWLFPGESAVGATPITRFKYKTTNSNPVSPDKQPLTILALGW